MHDSLLRVDREEGVFCLLIFVIMLWIFSCFRSKIHKMPGNEKSMSKEFTETFNIRKPAKSLNTSYQTKKHLSE